MAYPKLFVVLVILCSAVQLAEAGNWEIVPENNSSVNVCPPPWKASHNDLTTCAPAEGYFYMTGCKAADPGPKENIKRLIRQEDSIESCAFSCYNWNWNDLDCKYFKEPGCAGFDWYPNTGRCVMWTEICDSAEPQCDYPSCDNVYHFNRFDCFFGKDWGAFHLDKDRTQLRECAPLFPRNAPCRDGQQCSCITEKPTFHIVCAENCGAKASPEKPLKLQINCTSCETGHIYGYEWSINTFIDWETQSYTHRYRLGMAIDASVLKGGSDYQVSARVRRILQEGPCIKHAKFAYYSLSVAARPIVGYCKVEPQRGVALLDEFKVRCYNFTTDPASNTNYQLRLCDNFTDEVCKNNLLYEGTDSDMPALTLPPGDPNNGNKAKIRVAASDDFGSDVYEFVTVQVSPVESSESTGENSTGTLFQVLKGLTVGTDGGESKIKNLLAEQNEQVALSVALNTASVLNVAAGYLTDDQQEELRNDLVDTLGQVQVKDTYVAQQQVQALNEVTKSTGSLSENATSNAAALYGNLANFLEKRATESSTADVDVDNLEETALLVLQGSMKVLKSSTESINKTQSNSTDITKMKDVAKNTLGVLNGVAKALLKRRVAGGSAVEYQTDVLALKVQKVDASLLKEAKFNTPGGGTFEIPHVDDLLSGKNGTDNLVLDVQMTQAEENQYTWDPSASVVTSNVISLDVNTGTGEKLQTNKLNGSIKIAIPSTGFRKISKSDRANLALVTDLELSEILVFNMTMNKDDQILKLVMTPSFFDHTFMVVVATGGVPTFQDFLGIGNDTVLLLVCITNGKVDSRVFDQQCASPGPLNNTATNISVAYHFNGEKLAIFVRNVENATEDLIIHIGSITVVLDGTSRVPSQKQDHNSGSRTKRSTSPPADDLEVFQVCEEEGPKYRNVATSPQGPLIVFDTTALACSYWNETSDKWSSDGCEVAYDSDSENLECNCTHLSSFGGKFLVAPNSVNPIADIHLFATVFDNPVSVVMIAVMWVILLVVGVWTRRKDKTDFEARGITVIEDNHPRDTYTYLVTVITGWRDNAGTTSTVAMYLTGENGKSDRHLLTDPRKILFATGSENWFLLTTPESLGELISLDVWLDFTGTYPSWFLRQIIVRDLKGKHLWLFDHNAWIYPDKKMKKIAATIMAQRPTKERKVQLFSQFEMRTAQDLRDKHIWVSIFSISPNSNFSRLQRLACAFSFIFTAMLTNMMFYGVVPDDDTSAELAGFKFNWGQLIIAVESSLITVPINASLVWIFRNARLRPSQKISVRDRVKQGLEKAKSVQRLVAKMSDESLSSLTSQELRSAELAVHLELLEMARKLHVESDSLSSLSKLSSDSSDFAISSDSSVSALDDVKMDKLLHDIGVKEPLGQQTEKTVTKHFDEAIRDPRSDRKPKPRRGDTWLENPFTNGWVNVNNFDDLTTLLADIESRLPDGYIGSDSSSISTLSTVPSSIEAMFTPKNRNQSNRVKNFRKKEAKSNASFTGAASNYIEDIDRSVEEISLTQINEAGERPERKGATNTEEAVVSTSSDLNALERGNEKSSRKSGLCSCFSKRKKDKTEENPKKKSGIPWWAIYIGWTLAIVSDVISSYFIMLYGLKFGYEKSMEWLTSFFTSFFGSTIIFQPLKILAVSALFSYIMKSPLTVTYDAEHLDNTMSDEENTEADKKIRRKKIVRTDPRYYQPSDDHILQVNRRLHKEKKMKGFLRDLAFLFIFTVNITIIVYLHIPRETYYVSKTVNDVLVHSVYADGLPVEEIRKKDDIWEYLSDTLLPSVYNIPRNETDEAQFYLSDLTTTIIGVPRIRQLRVDHGDCQLPESVKIVSKECFREYSSSNEEKGDYSVAWSPLYENSTKEPNSAWVYHSAFKLETTAIWATHNTYGGGGYVAQLKSSRAKSEEFLQYWKDNRWIDRYTRAVIVEINTFHPATHLFSSTAIVFEAHASGAFTPYVQVLTSKLYFYSDPTELSSIAFEINFIILTIIMTVRELWKGCKQKKKYFEDPWNYIELLIIALSYSVLILYMQRIFLINRTLRNYKTGKCRNVFVSFYPAVVADYTMQYVVAALITAATVRYVKFLNLNKRILIISMAIRSAFSTVAAYAFLLTSGIIMFSAAGVLVMGPFCAEMYSPVEVAVSILHLILLDTQFEIEECLAYDITTLKGPIYIMTVGFVMIIVGVPLLQSILDFAIIYARHNRKHINEEYEILDFIYSRLKFWVKK